MIQSIVKSTSTLTKEQAESFLTKSDLEKIVKMIEGQSLLANVDVRSTAPTVVIRGRVISLFDILSILGTL